MDLSDFQRKAVILIFISILVGAILLARKEPFKNKEIIKPQKPTSASQPIPSKIDINTANISVIEKLPGIGPGLAREIINNRPYKTMEDLLKVPGIGEKRLARIKEMINLPENIQNVRGQNVRGDASNINMKIDLNTATIIQLSNIPGVGPRLADAILDYRENIGSFKNLTELMNVPRIGQKTYEKLKEYLYVEPPMAEAGPRPSVSQTTPKKKTYDSSIDPKAKCPYCGKQLWEKGKKKQKYLRCPYCLKLL